MRDYTKIRAWKLADDLTVEVYRATKGFPAEERYALTNQIRRAAYSAPSNIAEGANRPSKRDYLHFLHIALGSMNEVHYFLHLSKRLGYLNEATALRLRNQAVIALKTLGGLVKAVSSEVGG